MADNQQPQGQGGGDQKAPKSLDDIKRAFRSNQNKTALDETRKKINDKLTEIAKHEAIIAALNAEIQGIWEDYQDKNS